MTDQTADAQERQEQALTRAEWIAAAALIISCGTGLYTAGVEVQRLNDHDRRLASVEASQSTQSGKIETLLITTSRIDANVSALAQQAQERRDRSK